MDGGSAYGIGNTLNVVGVATTGTHVVGVVTVTQIYNNIGDSLRVTGVGSATYNVYNDLYRITGIGTLGNDINVASASTMSGFTTTGIGATNATGSFLYLTGEAIRISTLNYDKTLSLIHI